MNFMLSNSDGRILNVGFPPWANQDSLSDYSIVDVENLVVPLRWRDYRYVNGSLILDALPPTVEEQDELDSYQAKLDFRNLPNYATFTPDEAENAVTNGVFSGKTKAQLDFDIDVIPFTAAGMRAGMKTLAGGIVDLRTIVGKVARMVTLLRIIIVRRL